MGRAPQKSKRIIKTYVYETFYWKFGVVLCPFEKVKNKEKSEKFEIKDTGQYWRFLQCSGVVQGK